MCSCCANLFTLSSKIRMNAGYLVQKKDFRFIQERVLNITYYPLAVFRVRPVTRCTSSLSGHIEAGGGREG